ncbi:MAG: MaoC family dehydratase [Actinomycetota bacterium]|nr:MaoC family dehydratase [Actinomycetota bacterium]
MSEQQRILVGGPFFEDFKVGQVFDGAPAITITQGHTALYQAAFGDRMRLPCDGRLGEKVCRRDRLLVHPTLVCNIAIGQSTTPSQRVLGNMFYRRLVTLRPVFVGDTLTTTTEVIALKQNRQRAGKPSSGLVALRVTAVNQHQSRVLDFWRCPMIPLREPDVDTGHADEFDDIPSQISKEELMRAVPEWWDLHHYRRLVPGDHFTDISPGVTYVIEARDTITAAPEFVRLTFNMAQAHTDAGASIFGERLVYGGHTIALVGAQVMRALPNIVSIVAWRSCNHLGPVFEQDLIQTEVLVDSVHPLPGGHGLVDLVASAHAGDGEKRPVLRWHLVALMA